ncbi:FMN-dependent NADH-azoreductase [Jannaschia sp. R86511]|uniref:FMN-dependent NADH-azoreductase n=1 Tax=Jannaschia sp. R86511 TaxID=3093853 RepID=UPI0036D32CC9
MPTLLRVDASFRTDGSVSRAVADSATDAWLAEHPTGTVVRRDLSASPLPATAWVDALAAAPLPEQDRTPAQREAHQLVTTLADELIGADQLVLASPLFNFGVSQYTKVWIDLLIADPRLGPGTTALQGRGALVVASQGGGYRPGTPRHGWDHATAYLERILGDVFGMAVDTVTADLTLAPVTPQMAHLVEAAEVALREAHTAAAAHGTRLAGRSVAA